MDAKLRKRVEANLFPAARAAVEPWDEFSWHPNPSHCDAWRQRSSQALAIDLFGTLVVSPQPERDAILRRVSAALQLPESGPWQVELEWEDPKNRLCEPRESQVDAVATGACTTILFECKFTETEGGRCSQTLPREVGPRGRLPQCNGQYEMQVNPVNRRAARCALTGKGIRYWEFIPNIFKLDSAADYRSCPFDGPCYQWMRNLVLADAIGRSEARQTGFVIVYADHPNLPFPNKLASSEWSEFVHTLRTDTVQFHTISYQHLLRIAGDAVGSSNTKWRELETWVLNKIDYVGKSAKY